MNEATKRMIDTFGTNRRECMASVEQLQDQARAMLKHWQDVSDELQGLWLAEDLLAKHRQEVRAATEQLSGMRATLPPPVFEHALNALLPFANA